jgi:signal transduction histidine kinase
MMRPAESPAEGAGIERADPGAARPGRHAVQFFEKDDGLSDAVASFLGEGLNEDDPIVVIATEERRKALLLRLAASGVDVDAGTKSGRIVMADARETLARFMRRGTLDPALFRAVMGEIFAASAARAVAQGRQVRAYGEMVDVLWRDGQRSAALLIEDLWNDLSATFPFSIFCAYVLDSFFKSSDTELFEKICSAHTHVVPTEQYLDLTDPNARLRELARLQQRARALESELVHRKELEQELRAASETKNYFLSMLGHELRNPLAPIVTALHLVRCRSDAGSTKELDILERQVGRMTQLVDDLLDVARATGKVEIQKTPVDLADVLARAVEMTSPLFAERNHEVSLEVASTNMQVLGDRRRLGQAVTNLLTNAAKYTEEGGRVAVRAERDDGTVVVRVRDTGVGIPPETLARVFEPFAQAQQGLDRRNGGLGLGLPIVKQIAELHGGRVTVASEGHGLGTEVTLRLPAIEGDPAIFSTFTTYPQPSQQRPLRVLVVDDNEDAAEMLSDYLVWAGHATAVAHDAYAALDLVEGFRPDVGLLDIGLPGMDGYELGRRLRAAIPSICIVAVTGYGQDADRDLSAAAGFNAHLVKPLDMKGLAPLLDSLTGRTAVPS